VTVIPRPCHICGKLSDQSRCSADCKTTARGYGSQHEKLRLNTRLDHVGCGIVPAYSHLVEGEHMKQLLAVGVFAAAAVVLPASPAFADAPPGQGLETVTVPCEGRSVEVVGTRGDSASRWVEDEHVVLLSITVDGTPVRTFGEKTGLATNASSCTVGNATVVRAPVPPEG
jgi:hypothetical protein